LLRDVERIGIASKADDIFSTVSGLNKHLETLWLQIQFPCQGTETQSIITFKT